MFLDLWLLEQFIAPISISFRWDFIIFCFKNCIDHVVKIAKTNFKRLVLRETMLPIG